MVGRALPTLSVVGRRPFGFATIPTSETPPFHFTLTDHLYATGFRGEKVTASIAGALLRVRTATSRAARRRRRAARRPLSLIRTNDDSVTCRADGRTKKTGSERDGRKNFRRARCRLREDARED